MPASSPPLPFSLPFSHYDDLGYFPVPLNGKVPAHGTGWYDKHYEDAELKALDASGLNVGLRCMNVVGLDIDLEDAGHARRVEALVRKVLKLPRSTPRRVGKAPKALLVARVNAPVPGFDLRHGKRKVLFQLLGAGKQFVIHGIHPDTKKPYTLSAPLPPQMKLPLVTEQQLAEMRSAVAALLADLGYLVDAHAAQGAKPTGKFSDRNPWSATGMRQARAALAALDPDMARAPWIEVGMALHDGTHGSKEGLNLWDAWSAASEKYMGGRDLEKQWASFKPGRGTTKATLFKNDFAKREPEPAVRSAPADSASELIGEDVNSLLEFEPGETPWIVQDVLTYGAHLLVGRPKGGKSWITLDLAFACTNGGSFLGLPARQCKVLWIAAEDTRASLARRLRLRNEHIAPGSIVMTSEGLKAERAKWDECTFEAWLRGFLEEHRDIGLVIMDTHETVEAIWQQEQIDEKRNASIVQQAYQKSRLYEEIGQDTKTCILLVHHAAKRKQKEVLDYHELINLPATIVAGSTASMVLADPPDRDIHDDDDHRRIFAVRGRHIIGETPKLIELKDARVTLLGAYHAIKQTAAQAEVFEMIEAILAEQESTTIAEISSALGKHKNTVQGALKRAAKLPGGLKWKGRLLVIRAGRGISWQK